MRKLKLYCKNCSWETMIEEDYLEDNESCSMCGHDLIVDEKSIGDLIKINIEEEMLEIMKFNLKERGNNEVWYAIENNIDNPYHRIEYRKQFFKCKGLHPDDKIR